MQRKNKTTGNILDRFLKGTATAEENRQAAQWLQQLDISDDSMSKEALVAAREAMLPSVKKAALPVRAVVKPMETMRRWVAVAAVVMLLLSGWWVLHLSRPAATTVALKTITNNNSQIRYVRLPDGSQVWLNALSSLSFDSLSFNTADRKVALTGEGYFEVASKAEHPFIVSAGNINTTVLGTAFNIENYPGESELRVSLASGKVKLEDTLQKRDIMLAPGEMFRYEYATQRWHVMQVESEYIKDWTNGYTVFNELPLPEALARIGQKYNLRFTYDEKLLAGKRVTAHFRPLAWQSVLSDLLFVHHLTYEYHNQIVHIRKQ